MSPPDARARRLSRAAAPLVLPGLFRARDLADRGVARGRLPALLKTGAVQRVARGVYRLTEAPATEHETIATVCKRVPEGIVCLLSALRAHDIGTQVPQQVWVGLDRRLRRPRVGDLPIRVAWFSGPMLTYGVQVHEILGVAVRVTSPARTVIDCFRYRQKIGMDVALEALRDVVESRKVTADELVRTAQACRIATVMTPYLEALFA